MKTAICIQASVVSKAAICAQKSDVLRAKMAAVLYTDRNRVIAIACNRSLQSGGTPPLTTHAEAALIKKAMRLRAFQRFWEDGLNILVIRIRSDGSLAAAKPCTQCQKLIMQIRPYLKAVYYTDSDGCIQQM